MMSFRTARSGNLSGSSSGSTSSCIPQQAASFLSTASATASADPTDIPLEEVSPIPLDRQMGDLNTLTAQHITQLQRTGREDTEATRLQKILEAITTLRAKRYKKDQTPAELKEHSRLKGALIATLYESQ